LRGFAPIIGPLITSPGLLPGGIEKGVEEKNEAKFLKGENCLLGPQE